MQVGEILACLSIWMQLENQVTVPCLSTRTLLFRWPSKKSPFPAGQQPVAHYSRAAANDPMDRHAHATVGLGFPPVIPMIHFIITSPVFPKSSPSQVKPSISQVKSSISQVKLSQLKSISSIFLSFPKLPNVIKCF